MITKNTMLTITWKQFFFPFLVLNQSKAIVSYNTGYPMGASRGCTVLSPYYLREFILFVFCFCLVATHVCETTAY